MTWILRYKATERGPWIETTLRGPDSDTVWRAWSSLRLHSSMPDYHSIVVLVLE